MRPELPIFIDSTMITCFRQCPQKFWLEFCHGFRPGAKSIDLHAGGCFASALEDTYKGIFISNMSLEDAMMHAHGRFLINWGDFEIPSYKKTSKTMDRVWEAVEDYFTRYPPRTDHVQPYYSNGQPTFEFTFAIPLDFPGWPRHPSGQPFIYCGRFDLLGAYGDRPCVKDDKTTGTSISTNWSEKWDLRSQFIGYVWACQQSGIDLDTVVVRGIGILKTMFHQVEAMKVYGKNIVDRWLEQVRRDLVRIVASYEEDYWDYNLGDACTSYGNCIFLPVCSSTNPERWFNQYEVRHWNPLLKNPVVEPESGSTLDTDERKASPNGAPSVGKAIPDTQRLMEGTTPAGETTSTSEEGSQ